MGSLGPSKQIVAKLTVRYDEHSPAITVGTGSVVVREQARLARRSGQALEGLIAREGAERVASCGCSVGACGTERKPLASLGLGLTAALRVRSVRVGGAGCRLVSHTTRPEQGRRRTR